MSDSKNKNSIFYNEKGVTIVEMLIVIAIIGIMAAIIIVPQSNKIKKSVDIAAEQFADDVRKTQSQSINTKQCNGVVATGGYGIRLNISNNDRYIVFCNNYNIPDHEYDPSPTDEQVGNAIELPAGVYIRELKIGSTDSSPIDIVFQPPYSKTFIDGSDTSDDVTVCFSRETTCSGYTRTVTINKQGQVSE